MNEILQKKLRLWSLSGSRRRGHQVNFCCVSGRVLVKGKERDVVTKTATLRPAPAFPLPFRDLFPSIREDGRLH